jgi:hypothetical protein
VYIHHPEMPLNKNKTLAWHVQAPVMKRPQTLNYVNGYAVPGDTMQMGTSVRSQPLPTGQAAKTGEILDVGPPLETLPAWVAYDRKVLRFGAYFKEAVTEDPVENFRVRKCVPARPGTLVSSVVLPLHQQRVA